MPDVVVERDEASGVFIVRHWMSQASIEECGRKAVELLDGEPPQNQPGEADGEPPSAKKRRLEVKPDPRPNKRVQFGFLPEWMQEDLLSTLSAALCEQSVLHDCQLADEALDSLTDVAERVGIPRDVPFRCFDSFMVNRYEAGDGIKPHVDLFRYEDPVLGISFVDKGVLRLHRIRAAFLPVRQGEEQKLAVGEALEEASCFATVLRPGDAYLLLGRARYEYAHSIDPVDATRVSVTLRRLKRDPGRPVASLSNGA